MQDAPRRPRYESLDIWRGIACLLVLVNHGTFFAPSELSESPGIASVATTLLIEFSLRCWIGVPIFFVISGYCISASADRLRRSNGSASHYFTRRFKRIFPPYWAVLAMTVVVVSLIDTVILPNSLTQPGGYLRPWWYSPSQWLGNLTLTETWRFHAFGSTNAMFLDHAWTLCYEEQFYFVIGLLLLLAPKRLFLGATIVTIGCAAIQGYAKFYQLPIQGFFFDPMWFQFAAGILVYYSINYGSRRQTCTAILLLLGGVVWSISGGSALFAQDKNLFQSQFAAFTFALFLLAFPSCDTRFVAKSYLRPLGQCGIMCYSLYLIHLPVIKILRLSAISFGIRIDSISPFITLPIYSLISFCLANVFYKLVEKRFVAPRATTDIVARTDCLREHHEVAEPEYLFNATTQRSCSENATSTVRDNAASENAVA